MALTKQICTFLLVLAVLFPAISAQDDAISLTALVVNDSSGEESMAALPHTRGSDYDPALAMSLDWLETMQVGTVCALHFELSSLPLQHNDAVSGINRSITAPVGRAPPASFL